MAAVIRRLPRVVAVPEEPGRDDSYGVSHPMRPLTKRLAADPGSWDDATRQKVVELFDAVASEWHTRDTEHRHDPLVDALDRGGPMAGPCLELGCGIGTATPVLAERFGMVMAVELSAEMLRRAPADVGRRVLADGAVLPVSGGSVGALVLVNMFLFGPEAERVLAPGGAVVWVSSWGHRTPIHLPAEDVAAGLPGRWDGVAADAGWGSWCVLRRASEGRGT